MWVVREQTSNAVGVLSNAVAVLTNAVGVLLNAVGVLTLRRTFGWEQLGQTHLLNASNAVRPTNIRVAPSMTYAIQTVFRGQMRVAHTKSSRTIKKGCSTP